MRLGIGIFLGYLLIALLAGYFVLNVFVEEIKPNARQTMEDSLLDAANLLAEMAREDMVNGRLPSASFAQSVAAYQARQLDASIWGFSRTQPGFRIYITDAKGIVVYDSTYEAVGQDFSRWNDVYLTLKGKYGARSSPDPQESGTSATTMYVAAPIKSNEQIVGVLTIAKSNLALEPFIKQARSKIIHAAYWLLAASLILGILFSYWLSASVRKLVRYAESVTQGERAVFPSLSLIEIKRLGQALRSMRERLEGKQYIEQYTWTLTHEMKSPLTAIQAAAELLQEPMAEPQRDKFLSSIIDQSKRLHILIEKMLQQARLENRQDLETFEPLNLSHIVKRVVLNFRPKLQKKGLEIEVSTPEQTMALGDPFLLEQALLNILENAVDFSPAEGLIHLKLERQGKLWCLSLRDQGPGIPDYARERVFERFYSLPRPGGGAKSTGLGLAFVKEAMMLHGGRVELNHHSEGGAEARLFIPAMP